LEWYYKSLAICEKVLGREHPYTARTYYNIANVYRKQGYYTRALEWYYKALAIREKVLGREHPDTAAIRNNIAIIRAGQV
jgi:tetratricopeptide (TPR) repeat protein